MSGKSIGYKNHKKKSKLIYQPVFFCFVGHFDLFPGHLIEFNSSPSPDIFYYRQSCPACPVNFVYTGYTVEDEIAHF